MCTTFFKCVIHFCARSRSGPFVAEWQALRLGQWCSHWLRTGNDDRCICKEPLVPMSPSGWLPAIKTLVFVAFTTGEVPRVPRSPSGRHCAFMTLVCVAFTSGGVTAMCHSVRLPSSPPPSSVGGRAEVPSSGTSSRASGRGSRRQVRPAELMV